MTKADPVWQQLEATHPEDVAKVERWLAKDPEGMEDPNDRTPQQHAMRLALAAIDEGHSPPTRLDPLLKRACRACPEFGDHISGHEKLLEELTPILKAMDIERREAMLLQDAPIVPIFYYTTVTIYDEDKVDIRISV